MLIGWANVLWHSACRSTNQLESLELERSRSATLSFTSQGPEVKKKKPKIPSCVLPLSIMDIYEMAKTIIQAGY
jgi:hypothetical protein